MLAWILLIIAGLLEVGWAIGLKFTDGWTRLVPSLWSVSCMIVSFLLLSYALKTLPVSVAYAVWVGIGAIGVALVGILFLGESANPGKIFFMALIGIGIAGLKLTSH